MKTRVKQNLSTSVLVLIFICGLSIVLYPAVSNYFNERKAARDIAGYDRKIREMGTDELDELFERALLYNEQVAHNGFSVDTKALDGYESLLDVSGNGIMGYITIPKIDVELPVYHGTSDGVLQMAIGHLEGSSLPVGGESSHCVLSGHRGLPRAKLFTRLDELAIKDEFTLSILNRVLIYEIDSIKVVEPWEIGNLYIEERQDYVTLLTCTPYGINTHRLLVRGRRVNDTIDTRKIFVIADAYVIDTVTVSAIMAVPLTFVVIFGILIKIQKKRKQSKIADDIKNVLYKG